MIARRMLALSLDGARAEGRPTEARALACGVKNGAARARAQTPTPHTTHSAPHDSRPTQAPHFPPTGEAAVNVESQWMGSRVAQSASWEAFCIQGMFAAAISTCMRLSSNRAYSLWGVTSWDVAHAMCV